MPKIKLTHNIKKIIIKEHKKKPFLGVRALGVMLKDKYKLELSKSLIHNIIKNKFSQSRKGRKPFSLFYPRKGLVDLYLILIQSIDKDISLFDYISKEIAIDFLKLKQETIKKILILLSIYPEDIRQLPAALYKTYRLQGISLANWKYFLTTLKDYKIAINLDKLKRKLRPVSTVKFYFKNGFIGYTDAKFSSFWQGFCSIYDFYSPLSTVKNRLIAMLKKGIIMINYTKSYDYLTPLVSDFIKGIDSGIRRIDFLDKDGQFLESLAANFYFNISAGVLKFYIGFYSRLLSYSILPLPLSLASKPAAGKKMKELDDTDFFYIVKNIEFLRSDKKKDIFTSVLISKNRNDKFLWGILINKTIKGLSQNNPGVIPRGCGESRQVGRDCLNKLDNDKIVFYDSPIKDKIINDIKEYVLNWPYLEKGFLKDIKALETSYAQKDSIVTYDLRRFLPDSLSITTIDDFLNLRTIIFNILKLEAIDISTLPKLGYLFTRKNNYKLIISRLSYEAKNKLNSYGFYWKNKRIIFA